MAKMASSSREGVANPTRDSSHGHSFVVLVEEFPTIRIPLMTERPHMEINDVLILT
jgi:hypothetical protein